MYINEVLIQRLVEEATRARKEITRSGRIPGTSEFRETWFKHGPEDSIEVAAIWRDAVAARAEAHRKLKEKSSGLQARLVRIRDRGRRPQSQVDERHASLSDEVAELQSLIAKADSELAKVSQHQETTLQPQVERRDDLTATMDGLTQELEEAAAHISRTEAEISALREQHDLLREAAAHLSPLVAQARRQFGISPAGQAGLPDD